MFLHLQFEIIFFHSKMADNPLYQFIKVLFDAKWRYAPYQTLGKPNYYKTVITVINECNAEIAHVLLLGFTGIQYTGVSPFC